MKSVRCGNRKSVVGRRRVGTPFPFDISFFLTLPHPHKTTNLPCIVAEVASDPMVHPTEAVTQATAGELHLVPRHRRRQITITAPAPIDGVAAATNEEADGMTHEAAGAMTLEEARHTMVVAAVADLERGDRPTHPETRTASAQGITIAPGTTSE